MRDWSRGQALGYYSIQPSQFNTRMPLHINDDDLSPTTLQVDFHGHLTERPRSEFTMLSYTVYALEIAVMVRKSIDLRYPLREAQNQGKINQEIDGRNHLNNDYEQFLTSLPYHFRLGSTVGLSSTDCMAAIPVHRWMLHQQLWSLFLTIHSTSLSSASSRASCRLLAQNIISTQAQIQARCTVCGSLPTNETQLFNAAIVLLIDLLLLSKHKDSGESSIQLNRIMARDKIQEAIELLRARCDAEDSFSQQGSRPDQIPPSPRTATLLEELMQLEKSESSESEERNTPTSTESRLSQELRIDPGISLKEKVTHILDRFREPSKTKAPEPTAATTNMILIPSPDVSVLNPPTSISISTDGLHLQELDVLPMLSNDHEFGFWSSLDVPSLSAMDNRGDSTPSAEEFQLYTDPGACWPFTPPLGETPHITY